MKHKGNIFQLLGFLLILASLCLLLGGELMEMLQTRKAEKTAAEITAMLPSQSIGIPEDYTNTDMPVLQLKGQDYSGLLRVPAFGVYLPISSSWDSGSLNACPRRFWGSVYDNSLVIGGSTDQFGFCSRADLGDHILVTDMEGAQFRYEVARIERHPHADADTLLQPDWDLTLFARDSGSMNYIFLRCSFSPQSSVSE